MNQPETTPAGWRERLALRVVGCLADTSERADAIREILHAIRSETGLQHAAIRLRDGGDFPRYATESDAPEPSTPSMLPCVCERVLRSDVGALQPWMSEGGSLFAPDLTLAAAAIRSCASGPSRATCIHEGLATLVLVPLRHGEEIIGLLHLGDARPGLLTAADVAFLERLGDGVGVALSRRRALAELRKTEDTIRVLFEALGWGYALHAVLLDDHGRPTDYVTLDVNRVYEQIGGLSRADVVGSRAGASLPADELAQWIKIFGDVARTGAPRSYRAYSAHYDKHFRGYAYAPKPGRFAVAFEDVSDRIRAEAALQESEERFRTLADSLPQTVFESSLDGRLTYANRNAFDVFGYTPEDLESGVGAIEMIAPADRARAAVTIGQVMEGAATSGNEYEARRKDGTVFPVMVCSRRIMRGGRPVGLRGIIVDVSASKQAARERERLLEQVHHAQKMESIGTLAGGVAHDFNNLLAGILEGLSILDDQLGADSSHHADLKDMQALVMRGAELTKQMLGFARRGKLAPAHLDVDALVEHTAKWFGRTRKDIAVHLDCTPGLAPVLADRTQIEQVLLNLLLNAGQAMPEGAEILVRTGPAELSDRDASGAEAIELFRRGEDRADLVVLDVVMPGMSGAEAFDALRAIEPHVRVLLCSGYDREGAVSELLDRGCRGFLQKPFRAADLLARVKEALGGTE